MSTVVAPFFSISEDRQHMTILYGCSCGWRSPVVPVSSEEARDAVRGHLADAHGDEFEVGRCGECGQPTDYFRAHFPKPDGATVELVDVWLCEQHAPRPIVLDQAEPDEDDGSTPYNVLRSRRFTHSEGIDQ